jgi:LysR family glycine cleavage system transcriptional activator
MGQRFPSMTSLRAFEAAARHMSFTRAATELNLTQTAISHQIKNLEDLLGSKLFVRVANTLTLTRPAEEYLQSVRGAIVEISAATHRANEQHDENILTVQSLGTFAIKRLLPELHDFRRRYPSISLRLRTTQEFHNTLRHDFDIAIWHGAGGWIGVDADRLGDEEIFPVCSPRILESGPPLREPADLLRHTVIRTSSLVLPDEWPFWLEAAGWQGAEFPSELHCDYMVASLHAAIDGLGITLGRSTVVGPDLASGRLIEPFDLRARSTLGYFVVSPQGASERRKVKVFRDWLLERLGNAAVHGLADDELAVIEQPATA